MSVRSVSQLLSIVLISLFCSTAHAMSYSVQKAPSGERFVNVLRMKGAVEGSEWIRFMAATTHLDPSLNTLVVIDSPGGSIPDGFFLLSKVEDFLDSQTARGLKVVALASHDCSSMCVPIFFTFPMRVAVPETRIGLHGVSLGGLGYDGEMTKLYLSKLQSKAEARGDSRFLEWLGWMIAKGAFASPQLTVLSPNDLLEQDSRMIQGLANSEAQAIKFYFSGSKE